MTRPKFLHGAILALALAVAAAVGFATVPLLIGSFFGGHLVIAGLAAAYIGYLLLTSRERVGRVVVPLGWLIATLIAWALSPGLWFFLLFQMASVWLVRSLYHHSGILAAGADAVLCLAALAAAVWAAGTGSMFLIAWCFFLVQALFVWIPERQRDADGVDPEADDTRFAEARNLAERAFKRVATVR